MKKLKLVKSCSFDLVRKNNKSFEALESARVASLDLVRFTLRCIADSMQALDYGKHLFDKKKSLSSSKVKVKRNTTKEIKFRPSTDIGDYNIKQKVKALFLVEIRLK